MKCIITYKRVKRLSMRILKNGEIHVSAPLGLPRKDVEEFIENNKEWALRSLKKMEERLETRSTFYDQLPYNTKQQKLDAQNRLEEKILPMITKYEQIMGVKASQITFKKLISRWGCCNVRTKQINFSIYLLLLPDWCIEHIVVHELAHLLVPNHGPKFHAAMDIFFPRWKEARKYMREICR